MAPKTKKKKNNLDETPLPKTKKRKTNGDKAEVNICYEYKYTSIGDLCKAEKLFHIYGIVDKCDWKAKKTQSVNLSLSDKTEVGFICSVFAAKGENFPKIYPGDIVRIHSMQVYEWKTKLSGKCMSVNCLVVFSKSNMGSEPTCTANYITLTPKDKEKVKQMFDWCQKSSEYRLINEISRDDFMNIICQVLGVYIAKTTELVILKIWDGTRTNLFPGIHHGFQREKLNQELFKIARSHYVTLAVYGKFCEIAAQLKPGEYIEVMDAHLYSSKDNPDDNKLCLHEGFKAKRGINILIDEDEKLVNLKERIGRIKSDFQLENRTDALLSENNNIFLSCDHLKDLENTAPPSTLNQNVDNLNEGSQMSPTFPPFVDGTQEWWQAISTYSVTDGHIKVKPSSVQEILEHSVPFKFRTFAAVFEFKPETDDINKLIHLYCPTCFYFTENAKPDLQPFEMQDGVPYFHCPKCLVKTNDFQGPRKMEYTFLISLFLKDGSGPGYIEAFLWQRHAECFFKGNTPEQALRHKQTADFIFKMLYKICPKYKHHSSDAKSNIPILDCCVFSHSAGSQTIYQMFDTLLI